MKTSTPLLPALLACLGLWGCDADKATATMDDTNQSATARIFSPDLEPVANATVQVWRHEDTLRTPAAQTVTDSDGSFAVEPLPEGIYRVMAFKDGLVAMQDSVPTIGGRLAPKDDTLGPPAIATGIVKMVGSDNPSTVTILVMGTDILFNVDKSGAFRLEGLATGTYRLRLSSTLDNYTTTAATAKVASGKTTDLGTIRMNFTGIPPVDSLKAEIDSASNDVVLSWKLPDVANVRFVRIYREPLDGSEKPVVAGYSNNGSFRDAIDNFDRTTKDWLYTARIHTMDGDSGYPAWINVAQNAEAAQHLQLVISHDNFDGIAVGSTGTLWFKVIASPTHPRSLVWTYDGATHSIPVDSMAVAPSGPYAFIDSFRVTFPIGDSAGTRRIIATLTGSNGDQRTDTLLVHAIVPADTSAWQDSARNDSTPRDTSIWQDSVRSDSGSASGSDSLPRTEFIIGHSSLDNVVAGSEGVLWFLVKSSPSRPRSIVWKYDNGSTVSSDSISLATMSAAPSGSSHDFIDSFRVAFPVGNNIGRHYAIATLLDDYGAGTTDTLVFNVIAADDSLGKDSAKVSSTPALREFRIAMTPATLESPVIAISGKPTFFRKQEIRC